jgi:hypothetical protein
MLQLPLLLIHPAPRYSWHTLPAVAPLPSRSWASQVFDVPLKAAAASDMAARYKERSSKQGKQHPALLFGNQIVSGGGNAMVRTALMGRLPRQ